MTLSAPLPRVVVTTLTSVDGRITTAPGARLLDPDVHARWSAAWPDDVRDLVERRDAWLTATYGPTVVLEGSGTFVADDAVSPWPAADGGSPSSTRAGGPPAEMYVDHLPRRTPRWFAVVDSRGRVDWRFTGDDETALLVLVSRSTPAGYLARLRDLGVGYLVVGPDRVDLPSALARLRDVLGTETVVADGGGTLAAALFAHELVDELHVITFPALVGGRGTPSMLDGPPLAADAPLRRLRVAHREVGAAGSLWTRYVVDRPA